MHLVCRQMKPREGHLRRFAPEPEYAIVIGQHPKSFPVPDCWKNSFPMSELELPSANCGADGSWLEPLPYHRTMIAHLKRIDPDVWNWFAKSSSDAKASDSVRFELLKSTYRIERDSQPALYQTATEVAAQLDIVAPLTIYQSQHPEGFNASLAYVPGELHLVLHGPISEKLTPTETRALLGHEFAHYLLSHRERQELVIAGEMLRALTSDARAHPAHFGSWRLLGLYTEIFCDRAAYFVTRDLAAVVSMLVKVHTGVQEVSPEAYLRQADEIFARGPASTAGITHPEAFIRARAVRLWAEQAADAAGQIQQMIEGNPGIDELDLLAAEQVAVATRRLIDALLCRKWFQSDLVLAHARLYFDDYAPPAAELTDEQLPTHVRVEPDSLRDYVCFVLLDFVSADRDLDQAPLAAALTLAEQLQCKPRFVELARQELRLRKNQLEKIDLTKAKILADADRSVATP